MPWYLYIAEFKHGLYTGITQDIKKRIELHNSGKGAKLLIGKGPIKLVYSEVHQTHREAARREMEIKTWPRQKKLQLVSKSIVQGR